MANAIIAPNIDFYGLLLNGVDPIPEGLKAYLNEKGVNIIQKNGYVSVYGDYQINAEELRAKFPQFYDKYTVMSQTEYTFNGSPPLYYLHLKSNSKVTGQEKYWLGKDIDVSYSLKQAVSDVTRATIARMVFGKDLFSKTKFDVENQSVITRIMFSDHDKESLYDLSDVLDYFIYEKRDLGDEQKIKSLLINLVIMGLLTENRAISVFQMGCEIEPNNTSEQEDSFSDKAIKNIFPFKFWNFPKKVYTNENVIKFSELLPQLLTDFMVIYDIILEDTVCWNNDNISGLLDDEARISMAVAFSLLSDGMTQSDFDNSLVNIVESISKNDFEICELTRQKILADVSSEKSSFKDDEIEQKIIPQIDSIIATLKTNIDAVNAYYAEAEFEQVQEAVYQAMNRPRLNP